MSDPSIAKPSVSFDEFQKMDLRVGTIESIRPHPNADKLVVMVVGFGPLGKRSICAGIRQYYQPQDLPKLVGQQFLFCVNLEPRKMRGEVSEGMILVAHDLDGGRLAPLKTDFAMNASGELIPRQIDDGGQVS